MNILNRFFILDDNNHITCLAEHTFFDWVSKNESIQMPQFAGKRIKLAHVMIEMKHLRPHMIMNGSFVYLSIDNNGCIVNKLESYNNSNKSLFHAEWETTPDEFKTIMTLALKQDIPDTPQPLMQRNMLPLDNTQPKMNGLRELINRFPGVEVCGNHLTLNFWVITFDIIQPNGLISLLFIEQGLQHQIAKEYNLSMSSPDNNLRYQLKGPQGCDLSKIGLWIAFILEKRMTYKDINGQNNNQE